MVGTGDWWTDQKVEATVTKQFIHANLHQQYADQLSSPVFAELSENTYLQWILLKARRLFLILVHIGAPGEILRLIEESYDDDNLPLDADDVTSLGLPQGQQLNTVFYRTQFKYLVRVLEEGEHIRYAPDELVPLQKASQRDDTLPSSFERIRLPSPTNQVLLVRQFRLTESRTEVDVLSEIAGARFLSHSHILSVFGSYLQHDCMRLMMHPAAKYTLSNILTDRPKAFDALPKPDRRKHLITWPLCLANALAWLHSQGANHGAVRPSRILVDENFHVSLGYFDGDWVLGEKTSEGDLEAYSYAAPELWKRGLTVQAQSASSSSFGGRSALGRRDVARERSGSRMADRSATAKSSASLSYAFAPTSKGVSSRLRLEVSNDASSDILRRVDSSRTDRVDPMPDPVRRHPSLCRRYDTMSMRSSNSSEKDHRSGSQKTDRLFSIACDTKNAAVQMWKSSAATPATDVFGLAAVTMDILTVLCSRAVSAFTKHRGAKNRQAGRGGGLADSSFHANLSRIGSWAELLHKDAEKKVKKGVEVFNAIEHLLQVILQCLDKDPQRRLSASALASQFEGHLSKYGGVRTPHCQSMHGDHESNAQVRFEDDIEVKPLSISKRYPVEQAASRPWDGNNPVRRVTESYVEYYTPSASDSTSGTPYQSSTKSHGGRRTPDLYDLCEDTESMDIEYVQVKPRQNTTGRLVADFTSAHNRAGSTESAKFHERSGNTTKRRETNVGNYDCSPAHRPSGRQQPFSPQRDSQRSSQGTHGPDLAPLSNVYSANSLLARAARGSRIEDARADERRSAMYLGNDFKFEV